MNYAETVTQSITMLDILDKYGFQLSNKRNMCCPFHSEKTASFTVYTDGARWKCFGCSLEGNVIDFAKLLFDIDFKQALYRLNGDFNLGLEFGRPLTYRERLRAQQEIAERRRKQNELNQKKEDNEHYYWVIFDEWKRIDDNFALYAPKSDTVALNPLFIESLMKRDHLNYLLNLAELKRGEKVG